MKQSIPPVLRPEHNAPRTLTELAERFGFEVRGDIEGIATRGVTHASSDIRSGEVFVALPGARVHGATYAADARERGAVAVVTDAAGADIAAETGLPVLVTDDPRTVLAALASWIYGNDGSMPFTFGVTGTNGKTSTVHLQDALLQQLGIRSGMSSTAHRHIDGEVVMAGLTTPEASELHALFAYMREKGVTHLALEVSAQAIIRNRVDGIEYDVAGFTNLQRDHMNEFADMDDYLAGKLPMLRSERSKRAVVSLDTAAGRTVVEQADIPVTTIATAELAEDAALAATADWQVEVLEHGLNATRIRLSGPAGTLETTIPTTGAHMAANAGLAIVMLLEGGIAWDDIVAVLERDGGIRTVLPGRTELVTTGRGPQVYLDFAHNTESFEKTTRSVRQLTTGKLIVLFGVRGSGDQSKRHAMGKAAVEHADIAIITDHHLRWEESEPIRAALYAGAAENPPPGGLYNISPPEDAVVKAVSLAGPDDVVLWMGPGHQDFREIQGVRYPYSPRQLMLDALRDAGWGDPSTSSGTESEG